WDSLVEAVGKEMKTAYDKLVTIVWTDACDITRPPEAKEFKQVLTDRLKDISAAKKIIDKRSTKLGTIPQEASEVAEGALDEVSQIASLIAAMTDVCKQCAGEVTDENALKDNLAIMTQRSVKVGRSFWRKLLKSQCHSAAAFHDYPKFALAASNCSDAVKAPVDTTSEAEETVGHKHLKGQLSLILQVLAPEESDRAALASALEEFEQRQDDDEGLPMILAMKKSLMIANALEVLEGRQSEVQADKLLTSAHAAIAEAKACFDTVLDGAAFKSSIGKALSCMGALRSGKLSKRQAATLAELHAKIDTMIIDAMNKFMERLVGGVLEPRDGAAAVAALEACSFKSYLPESTALVGERVWAHSSKVLPLLSALAHMAKIQGASGDRMFDATFMSKATAVSELIANEKVGFNDGIMSKLAVLEK
ncbi:unnamed protein product, partial [Prorocentrum cordatum]